MAIHHTYGCKIIDKYFCNCVFGRVIDQLTHGYDKRAVTQSSIRIDLKAQYHLAH